MTYQNEDLQLRVSPPDRGATAWTWEVVTIMGGQEVNEILDRGESPGVMAACMDAGEALQRRIVAAVPRVMIMNGYSEEEVAIAAAYGRR
jgi:hypothetical protein